MEFCETLFNATNSTIWENEYGIPNMTKHQYLEMCARAKRGNPSDVSNFIIIPYLIIFLLSVVGNMLVILTLVQHQNMRTVTNMFLLNLAVSDLLLAMFCMPFTLVPVLMQKFIFGFVVCILIRYAQAVSVGVSCATLVAISLERFYAICQPLKSRRWQTIKHSYKVISGIWLSLATLMTPIAVFNGEMKLNNGDRACREIWPSPVLESLYTILLDILLLVLPLIIMAFSYGRISQELWSEISISTNTDHESPLADSGTQIGSRQEQNDCHVSINHSPFISRRHISSTTPIDSANGKCQFLLLRPAYNCRVLTNKKRVVKMLCVIVLEYFICWTPTYIIQSWTVLDYMSVRDHVTPLFKSLILLLAYLSACIHPITYCFMNKRFRQSFADVFRCCFRQKLSPSTLYSDASHLNGLSDGQTVRTSSNHVRITWKR